MVWLLYIRSKSMYSVRQNNYHSQLFQYTFVFPLCFYFSTDQLCVFMHVNVHICKHHAYLCFPYFFSIGILNGDFIEHSITFQHFFRIPAFVHSAFSPWILYGIPMEIGVLILNISVFPYIFLLRN